MENVDWTLDGEGILTLTIDTRKELGLSASGKSVLIAKGQGMLVRENPPGLIRLNLNVTRTPTAEEKRDGWTPPTS